MIYSLQKRKMHILPIKNLECKKSFMKEHYTSNKPWGSQRFALNCYFSTSDNRFAYIIFDLMSTNCLLTFDLQVSPIFEWGITHLASGISMLIFLNSILFGAFFWNDFFGSNSFSRNLELIINSIYLCHI